MGAALIDTSSPSLSRQRASGRQALLLVHSTIQLLIQRCALGLDVGHLLLDDSKRCLGRLLGSGDRCKAWRRPTSIWEEGEYQAQDLPSGKTGSVRCL